MEVVAGALEANKEGSCRSQAIKCGDEHRALRAGAWDYLPKPFSATHLHILIGRARTYLVARDARTRRQRRGLGQQRQGDLPGTAPAFRTAVELARRVAGFDASVMITGESGTGKEVVRSSFIAIADARVLAGVDHCAALPANLLERTVRPREGTFTDTIAQNRSSRNGERRHVLPRRSHRMSLPLRPSCFACRDGIVRRVGSEQEHDAIVSVRFISATNREPAGL
jgi:DNA-binding NtrC family response regulator